MDSVFFVVVVIVLFVCLLLFFDVVIVDSCKFLHDRSDYKSGWQLDREFEEENQGREGKL